MTNTCQALRIETPLAGNAKGDWLRRCLYPFLSLTVLFLVFISCLTSHDAQAQDAAPESPQTPAATNIKEPQPTDAPSSSESTEPDPIAKSEAEKEKQKTVLILMAALAAIIAAGVFGIAAVIVWARRLRRIARDLGPAQRTIGNDFWFLKPPKPAVSESNVLEAHRPMHPPQAEESSE